MEDIKEKNVCPKEIPQVTLSSISQQIKSESENSMETDSAVQNVAALSEAKPSNLPEGGPVAPHIQLSSSNQNYPIGNNYAQGNEISTSDVISRVEEQRKTEEVTLSSISQQIKSESDYSMETDSAVQNKGDDAEPIPQTLEKRAEAEQQTRPPHAGGVVSWSPPQPSWNPRTSCNIDEGPLATVTLSSISQQIKSESENSMETDSAVQNVAALSEAKPSNLPEGGPVAPHIQLSSSNQNYPIGNNYAQGNEISTSDVISRVEEQRKTEEHLLQEKVLEHGAAESSEPEFPELTPEMEDEIDKALHGGKLDERICKIGTDYLLQKDIRTLKGLRWINDLVINSYFELIVERSKQEGYPSVYAYNTFFYGTYKAKGYNSVKSWTQKVNIFSYDLNFIPLHLGVHWCLAVIDHRSKKICYYDSMDDEEKMCLELLHEYLWFEYKKKTNQTLDSSIYVTEVMKDIPLQKNASDCGMFTLKYAEYIARDAKIAFNQTHMSYFRRRMVYELLHSQLL